MSDIKTVAVHKPLRDGETTVIREENLQNKCDSCVHEFATCDAKHLLFLEDRYNHPDPKRRDSVVWCASYYKKD